MPLFSNYPNGFQFGVSIRGVPLMQTHPGKAYWVSNNAIGLLAGQKGGSDGNRGTFDAPFATLAYALSQCVANRGDIIFIKPGHAETISSATSLPMNVAGVAVVGLGTGNSRPSYTFNTANTATIPVSADNISIQGIQFYANFLSIASPFTLTTAKFFTVQACDFKDNSGVLNFLNIIRSTGAANTVDGLTVLDCTWRGLGTTSVNSFILSANDIDSATVNSNNINLARSVDAAILVTVTAGVLTNFVADANRLYSKQTTTANGSMINVGGTTSTGFLSNNKVQTLTTTTDKLFTTTVGLSAFNNLVSGVIGASGFLIPTADS
jgi:hypothetical protein